MGLKKYIFGSIVLAIIFFGYAFSLESGDYRVQIVDYVLILPVAVWIVLPMVILFILSVLHISYYGLKNYFALKSVTKDTQNIISLVNGKLLHKDEKINIQNKTLKEIGLILEQLQIDTNDSDFSCNDEKTTKTIKQIQAINSGTYISSKELKLDNSNPLMIKNLNNRIETDDNFALEVLKKQKEYSHENYQNAFNKVIASKSITTIKKLLNEIEFNSEMIIKLLKKDSEQEQQFRLENDQVLSLIKKVEFTNNQLVTIAKSYKSVYSPEQLIKLYEDISSEKEEYMSAYLYVLAEYEMIDNMRDVLENSSSNEFLPFKALVDLKDSGKHTYSIDSISLK